MKKNWLLLLVFLFPILCHADHYFHAWQNHSESNHSFLLAPEFQFNTSDSNYDADGAKIIPGGLSKYTHTDLDILGVYGLTSQWSIFAQMSWARANVDHATLGGESYGLADQSLGLNYLGYKSEASGLSLHFQFELDFPAYTTDRLSTDHSPLLGEGSTDYTLGAFLHYPFSKSESDLWTLDLGGGYTGRSKNFSAELPWNAAVSYAPAGFNASGFLASLSFYGFQSLKNDPNLIRPIYNGGSLTGGAINPTLASIRANLGYQVSPKLAFNGFYSQNLMGMSAPHITSFGLSLQAHWGSGDDSKVHPALKTPGQYGKSNQGFLTYGVQAKVTRVNDRLNLLKIDKGSNQGVAVGQVFDIFLMKKDGTIGEAIARTQCTEVKSDEAALSIQEYFKEVWIEEGFFAKQLLE